MTWIAGRVVVVVPQDDPTQSERPRLGELYRHRQAHRGR